jgi:hypothetical protein
MRAFVLAAFFFRSCLFPMAACAGNIDIGHIKDLNQRIGALGMAAGEVGIDSSLLDGIKKSMRNTLAAVTALDLFEERQYQQDHKTLDDVVWNDITDEIKQLYSGLSSMQAGAFSFMNPAAAAMPLYMQYPGYRARQAGTYLDFAQAYKRRVDGDIILTGGLQGYLKAALKANNSEFLAVQKAQEDIKKLKDASDNAGYYRQMWQAGDQVVNVINQEISQLRIDIQRHLDLRLQQSLNEQQERADTQAAFDWAVQAWQTQSAGKDY